MRITQFPRIRNHRVFRDFEWPPSLQEFGQYNLIYGWNGVGKTTLSDIFRAIQRQEPIVGTDIQVKIDNALIQGKDLSTASLPSIRVFNRGFVDRNVFESPEHHLPPVYYLGEDSTIKQQQVEALKSEFEALRATTAQLELTRKHAKTELDALCADRARVIKTLLLIDPRYTNYEAPKYRDRIAQIAGEKPTPAPLPTEERNTLDVTVTSSQLDRLSPCSDDLGELKTITERVQEVLGRRLVTTQIASLTDAPDVAQWVQTGLALHKAKQSRTNCLFCAQAIPLNRLSQLEGHFNDQLKSLQTDIDNLLSEIGDIERAAAIEGLPSRTALYPHLRATYDKLVSRYRIEAGVLMLYLKTLRETMNKKREAPFTQPALQPSHWDNDTSTPTFAKVLEVVLVGLSAWGALLGATTLHRIAMVIDSHNTDCDNFSMRIKNARAAIERDELVTSLPNWQAKSKALAAVEADLNSARTRIVDLTQQLATLEQSIRHHRKPADELTREMAAYLGRRELTFAVKDNGYAIMRGESPAMHLSDGERTAIAFMYFLKSLTDTGFAISNGIVVIDDPVSSMDANSMYCAVGYLRACTHNAKQLFVLTHNFTLFREVKNWFNYMGEIRNQKYVPSKSKRAQFYMLTNKIDSAGRNAALEILDPLLHTYDSEYHYLFSRIKSIAGLPLPGKLEEHYGVPNMARRLLETFTAFRAPATTGDLRKQLEHLTMDPPSKKARIFRFLNVHSHGSDIGEPEHDLSILSETPAILADVLDLIRQNDQAHYDAMMSIA